MVSLPTYPAEGLSTVGHHKVLNLSTSLVSRGHEERLFSKMELSFLFMRSTMVKGMSLFLLGWKLHKMGLEPLQ